MWKWWSKRKKAKEEMTTSGASANDMLKPDAEDEVTQKIMSTEIDDVVFTENKPGSEISVEVETAKASSVQTEVRNATEVANAKAAFSDAALTQSAVSLAEEKISVQKEAKPHTDTKTLKVKKTTATATHANIKPKVAEAKVSAPAPKSKSTPAKPAPKAKAASAMSSNKAKSATATKKPAKKA